jgi:predicted acetyltransferase
LDGHTELKSIRRPCFVSGKQTSVNIEIRPVTSGEADTYIRAVPGAAGMPNWEPEPAAHWAGPGMAAPYGNRISDADVARYKSEVRELDRTQAAFADGRLVGTSGVLTLEVTVPGGRQVALGGVTSVGVLPTHRRRGVLRAMMRAMLDDCRQRGETLAGLDASEGGIYGRFGFGPATTMTRWELARSSVSSAPAGRLELVDGPALAAVGPGLLDTIRRSRVGQVSAWPGQWTSMTRDGWFVLHHAPDGAVDGAAVYRYAGVADPGTVQVDWLDASSPEAYTDLWLFLADLDLTKQVVAAKRPPDEPLRWQLTNPRALRVTRMSDDLWIRLVDVPGALAARSYAVPGSLVLAVADEFCPWNEGQWRLDGGPYGAACAQAPAGSAADLRLDATTLGSLYLGGVAPGPLARAGRITELAPGALGRLTAMLAQPDAPFTSIGF